MHGRLVEESPAHQLGVMGVVSAEQPLRSTKTSRAFGPPLMSTTCRAPARPPTDRDGLRQRRPAVSGAEKKRRSPEGLATVTLNRGRLDHIAIDLGSRESQVCIRTAEGQIIEERRVSTRSLGKYLTKRPKSRVVLVTGLWRTCAVAVFSSSRGTSSPDGLTSTVSPLRDAGCRHPGVRKT